MLIGIDGLPLTSRRTGVGHYTFELAHALALIAPDEQFSLISQSPFHATVLAEIKTAPLLNLGLKNPATTLISRRWWAIGLPLYLKRAGIDLFHGTNYDVPLWNKRRNIITVHDLSIFSHPEKHKDDIGRRARRRLPIMIRSTARIITPTESVKREIVERFGTEPDKITVIPEAARQAFRPAHLNETAETRRRLDIKNDFILFVGTIEPRKNLSTLVRAFAQVTRRTSRQLQLVIAGGQGWLMDDFHLLINEAGIRDFVRMTGYLDDEDLRALYSSCKVFVYPSLYEGFGLPPLEAMACGAPVIASRISALSETLEDSALFIDPTDVEAVAKTIVDLLENEEQRIRLASRGLKHAARFSWEKTARLTLEAYYQVLGKT